MRTKLPWGTVHRLLTVLMICWFGAGCRPGPANLPATSAPADVRAPRDLGDSAATSTLPATRPVTGEPALKDLAPGWIRHDAQEFTISLPQGWQVRSGSEGLHAAYGDFEARNPALAGFLGGEAGLRDTVLWAFALNADDAPIVESLNVRRAALGRDAAANPEALLGPILEQYRLLSVEVTGVRTGFEIGGQPAAMIAYRLPASGREGKQIEVSGRQYLVSGDDLWVLTYTSDGDRALALAALAEQSARSFQER